MHSRYVEVEQRHCMTRVKGVAASRKCITIIGSFPQDLERLHRDLEYGIAERVPAIPSSYLLDNMSLKEVFPFGQESFQLTVRQVEGIFQVEFHDQEGLVLRMLQGQQLPHHLQRFWVGEDVQPALSPEELSKEL